eukprot:TRINITY_DN1115_c0_g1_i18.p1 TRINITY_DN1115_c0_g1~~TRINITY_DN1115_c0_g1_i18.p1  ORF type:complete len:1216 (+),score=200.89 TRINITY_DN1115_c0_g1_i18:123-3770(+)
MEVDVYAHAEVIIVIPRMVDINNYVGFRFMLKEGRVEFLKVSGGSPTVGFSEPLRGRFLPGVAHHVEAMYADDGYVLSIDGEIVLTTYDTAISSGTPAQIALMTSKIYTAVAFDNLRFRPYDKSNIPSMVGGSPANTGLGWTYPLPSVSKGMGTSLGLSGYSQTYVTLDDPTAIKSGNFSLSLWFRIEDVSMPSDEPDGETAELIGETTCGDGFKVLLKINLTDSSFVIHTRFLGASGDPMLTMVSNKTLKAQNWYHYTFVFHPQRYIATFIDGQLDEVLPTQESTRGGVNLDSWRLGAAGLDCATGKAKGMSYDDVMFFDRVLEESVIRSMYWSGTFAGHSRYHEVPLFDTKLNSIASIRSPNWQETGIYRQYAGVTPENGIGISSCFDHTCHSRFYSVNTLPFDIVGHAITHPPFAAPQPGEHHDEGGEGGGGGGGGGGPESPPYPVAMLVEPAQPETKVHIGTCTDFVCTALNGEVQTLPSTNTTNVNLMWSNMTIPVIVYQEGDWIKFLPCLTPTCSVGGPVVKTPTSGGALPRVPVLTVNSHTDKPVGLAFDITNKFRAHKCQQAVCTSVKTHAHNHDVTHAEDASLSCYLRTVAVVEGEVPFCVYHRTATTTVLYMCVDSECFRSPKIVYFSADDTWGPSPTITKSAVSATVTGDGLIILTRDSENDGNYHRPKSSQLYCHDVWCTKHSVSLRPPLNFFRGAQGSVTAHGHSVTPRLQYSFDYQNYTKASVTVCPGLACADTFTMPEDSRRGIIATPCTADKLGITAIGHTLLGSLHQCHCVVDSGDPVVYNWRDIHSGSLCAQMDGLGSTQVLLKGAGSCRAVSPAALTPVGARVRLAASDLSIPADAMGVTIAFWLSKRDTSGPQRYIFSIYNIMSQFLDNGCVKGNGCHTNVTDIPLNQDAAAIKRHVVISLDYRHNIAMMFVDQSLYAQWAVGPRPPQGEPRSLATRLNNRLDGWLFQAVSASSPVNSNPDTSPPFVQDPSKLLNDADIDGFRVYAGTISENNIYRMQMHSSDITDPNLLATLDFDDKNSGCPNEITWREDLLSLTGADADMAGERFFTASSTANIAPYTYKKSYMVVGTGSSPAPQFATVVPVEVGVQYTVRVRARALEGDSAVYIRVYNATEGEIAFKTHPAFNTQMEVRLATFTTTSSTEVLVGVAFDTTPPHVGRSIEIDEIRVYEGTPICNRLGKLQGWLEGQTSKNCNL